MRFTDLESGDVVELIAPQWDAGNKALRVGDLFVIEAIISTSCSLFSSKTRDCIFACSAFRRVDSKKLSELERVVYRLTK